MIEGKVDDCDKDNDELLLVITDCEAATESEQEEVGEEALVDVAAETRPALIEIIDDLKLKAEDGWPSPMHTSTKMRPLSI